MPTPDWRMFVAFEPLRVLGLCGFPYNVLKLFNLQTLFQKIEEPFLQAAKTTLGDRYTPNIENIYKLTIKFILENLVKGYEDAGQQNGG